MSLRTRRVILEEKRAAKMAALAKRDPEIVKLENELLPYDKQGTEVGSFAFDGPVPAYLDDDVAGAGIEEIKTALSRPRLDLMHAMTPRVREQRAREGQWWHSVDDELLDSPVRFIPCKSTESAILWRPRSQGGGRLAIALDLEGAWDPSHAVFDDIQPDGYGKRVRWETKGSVKESGLLGWGSMDPADRQAGGFAGTAYVNVLAFFPDHPHLLPAVIGFSKSGYDTGCRLNTQLRGLAKSKGKASYSCLFELSTRVKKNAKGEFLVPVVTGIGWAAERDRLRARDIYHEHKDADFTDAALAAGEGGADMPPVPSGNEDAGDY